MMLERAEEILAAALLLLTIALPIVYFRIRRAIKRRRLHPRAPVFSIALRGIWRTVAGRAVSAPDQKVLLTLEEYFEGNQQEGSIAPNLLGTRGATSLATFCRVLKGLRNRSGVHDVLVEVDPREDQDQWPFAESVLVRTSIPTETVEAVLVDLRPDSVEVVSVAESSIRVWWD